MEKTPERKDRYLRARDPPTTIGLRNTTKQRLDKKRAPGQCYDGFLCQMIDLWERAKTPGSAGVKKSTAVK